MANLANYLANWTQGYLTQSISDEVSAFVQLTSLFYIYMSSIHGIRQLPYVHMYKMYMYTT